MKTYEAVRDRILFLLDDKRMSIHKLAIESAVAPSTIKNILYGKERQSGNRNHKNALRRVRNTLTEFLTQAYQQRRKRIHRIIGSTSKR